MIATECGQWKIKNNILRLRPFFPPSQQGSSTDAAVPASALYSKPVRTVLAERLVGPVLQQCWGVTAVRFNWPFDHATTQLAWQQIVQWRESLDAVIRAVPDCVYFVSAVTATVSNGKVLPAVGYWIVMRSAISDCKLLMAHLTANKLSAKPKLLLQPYQKSEKDFSNALFKIVKDNMSGCVPRLMQESVQICGVEGQVEPAVRICGVDPAQWSHLETVVSELCQLRFTTKLVTC